jgi:hypothetical protein
MRRGHSRVPLKRGRNLQITDMICLPSIWVPDTLCRRRAGRKHSGMTAKALSNNYFSVLFEL